MKTRATQHGQSLVEFALTIPLILFIIFVFIDLGRAIYYYSALNNAVREGARQATVSRFDDITAQQDGIRNTVLSTAISVPVEAADIDVYCDLDVDKLANPCDSYITVSAQIEFDPITLSLASIIGLGNQLSITAESTMQMSPYGKYK